VQLRNIINNVIRNLNNKSAAKDGLMKRAGNFKLQIRAVLR